MNETVYLFALSLPALLVPIVADPDEKRLWALGSGLSALRPGPWAPALPVTEEQAVAEPAWI